MRHILIKVLILIKICIKLKKSIFWRDAMSDEVIEYKKRIRHKLYNDEVLKHFRFKKDDFIRRKMNKTSFKKVLFLFDSKKSFEFTNIAVNIASLVGIYLLWGQLSSVFEQSFIINAVAFVSIMSLFSITWARNPFTKYIYRFIFAKDINDEKEKLIEADYKNQKLEPDDIDILSNHLDRDEMRFLLIYFKDHLNYRTIDVDQLEYEKSEIIRESAANEKLEELLDSMYDKPLNKRKR